MLFMLQEYHRVVFINIVRKERELDYVYPIK